MPPRKGEVFRPDTVTGTVIRYDTWTVGVNTTGACEAVTATHAFTTLDAGDVAANLRLATLHIREYIVQNGLTTRDSAYLPRVDWQVTNYPTHNTIVFRAWEL